MSLSALKVGELDELAERHGVENYPADGKKDEKLAALEAAGIEGPDARYRFRLNAETRDRLADENLREELRVVRFWAGGRRVELTAADDTFETRDPDVARGLRDLPMLEEVDA